MKIDDKDFLRSLNNKPTYSQAGQDLFVIEMLNEKNNGVYLEIGGSHPFESSNTYLLEKKYGWRGISFEIDEKIADFYNSYRKNNCIVSDATITDYVEILTKNQFPLVIDYLSIDIEPSYNTYNALLKLPLDQFRFNVITYEHERYLSGEKYMELSRKYLSGLGYKLIVANVKSNGRDFEDWWVDPTFVNQETYLPYINSNIEFRDIFEK